MAKPQPRANQGDPRSFLPLTPLTFHVLLALADDDRHGYGIIRHVVDGTDGLIQLRTGTLYTLLARLVAEDLVEESDARPEEGDDERRRYYRLTSLGRAVAGAEVRRLESLLKDARRKRVFGRAKASR
jgi:DNA-binding PadR family transcriptional regulator